MRTLGLFASVLGFTLFGAYLVGVPFHSFIQVPALVTVLGTSMCYLIFAYGVRGSWDFMMRLLSNKITAQDSIQMEKICTMGYLSGAMTFLTGMIHVFGNLADASVLGMGIAVAFVGAFYGAIPTLLLTPFMGSTPKLQVVRRRSASYATATVACALMCFFSVLYALSQGRF